MTWPPIAVRLIPAHTGNTPLATYSTRSPTAHPRPYGEHGGGGVLPPIRGGSSPHTRGPYGIRGSRHEKPGLIPAHTGTITSSEPGSAHPRTHGEHLFPVPLGAGLSGSFPHTRGRPRLASGFVGPVGLIPAHAGTMPCCLSPSSSPSTHSRTHGEH